jgi:hypothetical protein
MLREAAPLRLVERGPTPVRESRRILRREADSEWLGCRALRLGDVSLKLDGVSARVGDRVDKCVREPEASVVEQPDLSDHERRCPQTYRSTVQLERRSLAW